MNLARMLSPKTIGIGVGSKAAANSFLSEPEGIDSAKPFTVVGPLALYWIVAVLTLLPMAGVSQVTSPAVENPTLNDQLGWVSIVSKKLTGPPVIGSRVWF